MGFKVLKSFVYYRKILVFGIVFGIVGVLVIAIWWKSPRLIPQPGWMVGYHTRGDLVRQSMLPGVRIQLLPEFIEEGHRLAAPAIASRTPTIYYVDRTNGTLMAYTQGAERPITLYTWPMKSSPVKESPIRAFSPIADHIEWLLLTPNEEALLLLDGGTQNGSHLIEYTFATGQYQIITTASFKHSQRPEWLDHSHLLVSSEGQLAILDIQTGELQSLMKLGYYGTWALSPDQSRLLIRVQISSENPFYFALYEFPSLRLLKMVPADIFAKYDGIMPSFNFVDQERVLLGLTKGWLLPSMFTTTHLLDLRTMKHRAVSMTYLNNMFYIKKWPKIQ